MDLSEYTVPTSTNDHMRNSVMPHFNPSIK